MSAKPQRESRGQSTGKPRRKAGPPRKRAEQLARTIVKSIYEEGLKPGDRFLSEAEAVARYGVARGTLREALRFLQIQGVIEIRTGPGGGHFVSAPDWEHLAMTLALLLQFAGASAQSLIDVRAAIEPAMARMAAENATAEDVQALDDALGRMERDLEDYPRFHAANMAFWDGLARATQRPLFAFLSPALRRITHAAGMIPDETGRVRALTAARDIRHAVVARDGEAAFREMEKLEQRYLNFSQAYPRQMAKTISWADFQDER